VIDALRTILKPGEDEKKIDYSKEDVLMSLLEAIDTPQELEDYKAALNDNDLFKRTSQYLKATRAELLDFWPVAFIAACFGVAMFGMFTSFATASADEVVNQGAADEGGASPSTSPVRSRSSAAFRRIQTDSDDDHGDDFDGMDANDDGRVTRSEARAYRARA